jgi:NAD(P)-dependent dehydrogenase (short-subunit alcohol dehydrogenase family)
VAVVTGAARGIGQAIAVGLASQGATVVVGDVGGLAETSELIAKAGHPAVAVRLDISDPAVVPPFISFDPPPLRPLYPEWSPVGIFGGYRQERS